MAFDYYRNDVARKLMPKGGLKVNMPGNVPDAYSTGAEGRGAGGPGVGVRGMLRKGMDLTGLLSRQLSAIKGKPPASAWLKKFHIEAIKPQAGRSGGQ